MISLMVQYLVMSILVPMIKLHCFGTSILVNQIILFLVVKCYKINFENIKSLILSDISELKIIKVKKIYLIKNILKNQQMKLNRIIRNSIISTFISVFLVIYFLFLIQNYIMPNNYQISIGLFFGFAIIIIGIFYFFLKINSHNKIIAKVKILEENSIKTILIVLMALSILYPLPLLAI